VLIARIYEVFPLVCPICAGQMRLIAFITDRAEVRKILDHIGVDSLAPRISPARGPPLWDDCDAQAHEAVEVEPDWDASIQTAPDCEVDQRINCLQRSGFDPGPRCDTWPHAVEKPIRYP